MTEKHCNEILSKIENEIKSAGLKVKIIENPDGKLLESTVFCCWTPAEFTNPYHRRFCRLCIFFLVDANGAVKKARHCKPVTTTF